MFAVRTITHKRAIYLRAEDVAAYVRKLAETEPTDTRKRLEDAANKLHTPTEILDEALSRHK